MITPNQALGHRPGLRSAPMRVKARPVGRMERKGMNKKKQRLIDVSMPTPIGWLVIGAILVFLWINPFHVIDRVFALAEKDTVYGIAINIAALAVSIPYYLRMRRKLHKYEEDKWDDK